jgi:peroxisome-assembly ATPase
MRTSTSSSTSLSITNPLILYRTLIATNKLKPDPAQHRLALHLQKLYYRLKDYSPEISYRTRLDQIARSFPSTPPQQASRETRNGTIQRLRSLFSRPSPLLALTRSTPLHDSALGIDSPQGLMLHGEVGRGKSLLLDLLYSSLPSSKKRRWHFNTFMLDVFRRIERERVYRLSNGCLGIDAHEHLLLSIAKDTVSTSPILFLDEFQMPDRASSKLMNGFMTAFFHLGGVLVASSNRMPEELAKASGIEFGGRKGNDSFGQKMAKSDFGLFVEVLRGRCQVWEMEGERDWRREGDDVESHETQEVLVEPDAGVSSVSGAFSTNTSAETDSRNSSDTPQQYHIITPESPMPTSLSATLRRLNPSSTWTPTTLSIYSRRLHLPTTYPQLGLLLSSFPALCNANLGPADYITICSNFHTLILTDVPVLTVLKKNEARRFITLLDALYEAKCRLLISAEAPPDRLFFPEMKRSSASGLLAQGRRSDSDSIESEAFSEMYQDSTSPFRPNVSMYDERHKDVSAAPTYAPSIATSSPHLRTILADEDADFGPTYGNGRSHGASSGETGNLSVGQTVDFTNLTALTGEDERFAYKRARSRLWEMCGRRWWRDREGDAAEWWLPVNRNADGRFWEGTSRERRDLEDATPVKQIMPSRSHNGKMHAMAGAQAANSSVNRPSDSGTGELFRHGASPYRVSEQPPPKFGWQHAWGMMTWGKKAGEWGRGVEGERRKDRGSVDSNTERK